LEIDMHHCFGRDVADVTHGRAQLPRQAAVHRGVRSPKTIPRARRQVSLSRYLEQRAQRPELTSDSVPTLTKVFFVMR
jgi:hypothetical protein